MEVEKGKKEEERAINRYGGAEEQRLLRTSVIDLSVYKILRGLASSILFFSHPPNPCFFFFSHPSPPRNPQRA